MVAVANIPKGTRILSEAPLFTYKSGDIQVVERTIVEQVKLLNREQQHAFFALHNAHVGKHSPPHGITRTNVLPLGPGASWGGLFLEASRINHACWSNAQNSWNENIKKITIHAVRDIKEGEEITIIYTRAFEEYSERQRFLKDGFSFNCGCKLCSLPPSKRKESDLRIWKLKSLDELLGRLQCSDFEPELVLQLVYKMLRLFEEEDILDARLVRAYDDAFAAAIENGDEARAKIFAEKAYAIRVIIEGDDSPATMKIKRSAEQPTKSSWYIEARKSLHERDSPPQPDSQGFEDWLWMKDDWPIAHTPDTDEPSETSELSALTSIFETLMAAEKE